MCLPLGYFSERIWKASGLRLLYNFTNNDHTSHRILALTLSSIERSHFHDDSDGVVSSPIALALSAIGIAFCKISVLEILLARFTGQLRTPLFGQDVSIVSRYHGYWIVCV
jgi:hypothetical protein